MALLHCKETGKFLLSFRLALLVEVPTTLMIVVTVVVAVVAKRRCLTGGGGRGAAPKHTFWSCF